MKVYKVISSKSFEKQLKKMDRSTNIKISKWIKDNLEGCSNPKIIGKALQGNLSNYWRYRVGNYRLIAEIKYDELIIIMIYM